ncbi:hypothetical protein SUGI_0383090 [Cryptomeria japonica]|nr:hypothetical protein SUGI_0383090 [Cryptomeria japonica]
MIQKKIFLIAPTVISTLANNAKANIKSLAIPDAKESKSGDISTLCKQGRLKEAIDVLKSMDFQRVSLDISVYISLLQCCANTKALLEGKLIHAHGMQAGFLSQHGCGLESFAIHISSLVVSKVVLSML